MYFYPFMADYLQEKAKGSTVYGFKGGPAGIMKCKYVELTPEFVYPFRNQVAKLVSNMRICPFSILILLSSF
jgi:6-phosphofructokinase